MRKRDWLLLSTILLASAVSVRLGIWQLSRRSERLAFNELVEERLGQTPMDLSGNTIDPQELEYRRVRFLGSFDYEHEILLRNRSFNGQPGVHIITPLLTTESEAAVLVDRGWVPLEQSDRESRRLFQIPGKVEVLGIARASQPEPSLSFLADPTPSPDQPFLEAWRFLTIERIQRQMPYPLQSIYIEQTGPDLRPGELPRSDPDIDLSQGPHLSYAIQWFSFAAIGIIGGAVLWRNRSREQGEES
jgi:surfeit locus 1 family protein